VSTTPVLLSDTAADKLRGILSEGKYKAIRFALEQNDHGEVRPGMFLVQEVPEGDLLFNDKGISLLMDHDTAEVLGEVEVDLVKEG
jgi:Fe-S cluster assembly iron-binding protein IscA